MLVPAGLAAAVSGLVMAVSGRLPAYDNTALMWLRLFFGTLMWRLAIWATGRRLID